MLRVVPMLAPYRRREAEDALLGDEFLRKVAIVLDILVHAGLKLDLCKKEKAKIK